MRDSEKNGFGKSHTIDGINNGLSVKLASHICGIEWVSSLCDECQPGRAIGAGVVWPVVLREHAAHDIFIDVNAEGESDLLGDAQIAELWIASLHINNGCDELRRGAFRSGFAWLCRGREEQAVLSIDQGLVKRSITWRI